MTFILPHNPRQDRRLRAEAQLLEATADDRFVYDSLRIVTEASERIRVSRLPMTDSRLVDICDDVDREREVTVGGLAPVTPDTR